MFFQKKKFVSPHGLRKRRKQYAIRTAVGFLLFVFLFGGLAFLSQLPALSIVNIAVSGNTTVSEEDIREFLHERLAGNFIYAFSRANTFLLQPNLVEKELLETFKKIKEVQVKRTDVQSIIVSIVERKPLYVWCAEGAAESDDCYFLDIDGFAFAPAPHFSGHVYFEFYKSFEAGGQNPIGSFILPETEFKRFISFRNALREIGFDPYALLFLENDDYSFLLPDGTQIFFNGEQDFDLLVQNLSAALDTEQLLLPRKRGASLEYIDVRFENKVYYRFK